MKRFIGSKQGLAILAAAALGIGTMGTAFAYWTQSGSGSGTSATGTTTAVTVNQTTVVSGMYPGMEPVTLSGDFDNPNPGNVKVGSVTATLGTLPSGCVAADFTIGGTAPVNAEIAAGNDVGSWTGLTIKMNNTSDNQDGCKGDTIPLVYAVSAAS